MRSCREKEIKFLVRTLARNLRIGAMLRTVLPALGRAIVMNSFWNDHNKELSESCFREKLEGVSAAVVEAYNILPSLVSFNCQPLPSRPLFALPFFTRNYII
jgi:DNA ligase-1